MTAPAVLQVFVWFEADPADDAAVVAAVRHLVEAMSGAGDVRDAEGPRLLRRPDLRLRDGQPRATWMEIWPGVPAASLDAWLAHLASAAQACGVAALAAGGRHVEPFAPVA